MTDQEKTTPSIELKHYGVAGMKWGHRKAASADDIRAARQRVDAARTRLDAQQGKAARAKGAAATREKSKYENMRVKFLKNPDRATAVRMTRGEKASALILGTIVLPGVGTAIGAGAIASRSALSRRIEQKQETGQYKKRPVKAD